MTSQPEMEALDEALIEGAKQAIMSNPNVVGLIDGHMPGEFLVLMFQHDETGDQAMTLETWTGAGPSGRNPGEFMVAFRPAHLEALAYLFTNARKILETNGFVAKASDLQ